MHTRTYIYMRVRVGRVQRSKGVAVGAYIILYMYIYTRSAMLVVCRRCARQLRVFNLSGGVWGNYDKGTQLAVLAVRSFNSKTTTGYILLVYTCIHVYVCMDSLQYSIIYCHTFIMHPGIESPKTPVPDDDRKGGITGGLWNSMTSATAPSEQSSHCVYDVSKPVAVNRLTSGEPVDPVFVIVGPFQVLSSL